MQPATAPFILRSLYKDEHVTENNLTRPVTELLSSVFGAQFANRQDTHIAAGARGVYTFFSMLKGQTLGEEFCNLLPVTQARNTWHTVGTLRKALLALFLMLEPSALFKVSRYFFPHLAPDDVMANVSRVVRCLFFLFEAYGTLPHRMVRIRFLSLMPSQSLANSDGAPGSYLILGLVLMVELVVRFRRYSKSRAAAQREGNASRDGHKSSPVLSDAEEDGKLAETGKCMLCLSNRKHPTATQCGHIFCWHCVAEWIRSNPREAICPFCRQHISANSLVPLLFYVAKEPPRLGGA